MSDEQLVTVRESERAFVVAVTGEIDVDAVNELHEALARALRANAAMTVVDLSETEFADSSLLNLLLEAQQRHTAEGQPFAVAGPFRPAVTRLFRITGTADHLPLAETVDAAARQVDSQR
ncbi:MULTISPECIES: STAS domain-containing protein [Streptomyces]|uniref:STAS domain-containing protein n=1 Tax=Streptomyces TaxID=1883 RepID=UPI001290E9C1|nr:MULTISPECIES: STAS domain-containing protein [Streptomyces]MCX5038158.1 STAS domain-containing protein [Streptomyces coelicoflavus]QFX84239.1 anti-sigma factor antagonist [Streptomyces sp. SYP-A7193]